MKTGIIGAMELEVNTLQSHMTDVTITEKAGMKFYDGKLQGKPVVVVQCGIGKVNAGMCVQILADLFSVDRVINTGVAGSLNADLDIGDILISEVAVQHDFNVTALGYEPGQIPGVAVKEFSADKEMAAAMEKAAKTAVPDLTIRKGRVCSGDIFVSGKEIKKYLIETFAGDCAEMEGAAIAQACFLNQLPYLVVRAISDKADDSAQMDYPTFEKKAAEHCAALVEEYIKEN